MFKIKHNFKRIISIMCVLTLLVQTIIVSASDANKSDFQLAIENATYTSTYADSETADMALATAKEQVQAVISARAEINENTATFVVNNSVLSVNAKGGTYTFTVTVTLGDGSSSFTTDTLTMNVSARPEPLKVVFDNETTVNNAQFFSASQQSLVTEDGKTFIRVEQNSSLRPLRYGNFAAQAGVSSIDFDKYPYVRISWKNNDVMGWNSAFFYWGPTGTDSSFELYPYGLNGQDTGWKEILFDMKAGQYTFLKGRGTYGSSGTCPTWSGEGLFSFSFSNSKGAFVGDIEYIAFFGSKAEAEAYPVEIGNLKTMLETAEYTATYTDADSVEKATELVTPQVQAVIDEWTLDSGETATFTIQNGELSRYSKGGTFTFDVTVTEADVAPYDVSLTMAIGARPKPLAVVFDDEETVAGAHIIGAASEKGTFVDETDDGGKAFMRVVQGSKEMIYNNFVTQCGLDAIDFDQYPYVKISFRSDDPTGWDEMQLYWFKDGGNAFYNYYPWQMSGGVDTDWKEVIFDMRTGNFNFAKGSGAYGASGTGAKNGNLSWTGKGTVRFDLCNFLNNRTVDLEYVAFFATEEEANAYPVDLGSLKYQLENSEYTATYIEAQTMEKATAVATSQVQAVVDAWILDVGGTATFTIKNGQLLHLEDGGTFSFDVTVTEVGLAPYDVSLTMTIDARLKPLVVLFDDEETVNNAKFFNASEKSLVTEGDKTFIRVAQTSTARPLRYSEVVNQLGVSKIDFDKYPYVKISWKNNDALGWNSAFLYWGTSTETENSYEFYPYQLNGSGTDWKEVLFDMRTGEYTFLKGSGTYGTSGTCSPSGTVPWEGEGYFSFTPSNSKGAFVGDIEYIAFFATKEEAESYSVIKDRAAYFEELTIDTYRSETEFSYPEAKESGYVFAGWYDVETKKPLSDTVKTGQALAKFVDADVLKVKVQAGLVETPSGNVIPDDMASLRFVTTVDDVDYKEVAFMISIQKADGTYPIPSTTVTPENAGIVYERLYYVGMNSGDTMKNYVPSVFSQYSRYFKTYTLSDIPGTAYDTNIRITPYWETLDGTTVYGQTRTITVNEVKIALAR